jgi:teichuronic acid biosynthesis glycosyltransferase TuaC
LIVTSEDLHPHDTYTCSFELSLAGALVQSGTGVSLLSVYSITPKNLLKAVLVKCSFGLKKNRISERFSFGRLFRLALGYFLLSRKVVVLLHRINGLPTWESIGIHPVEITGLEAFEPVWVNVGREAFARIPAHQQPNIIHAHSRFFLAASLANELHHRTGIPYVITEHSSYYFRDMVPVSMVPSVSKVYHEAAAATAVSRVLAEKVKEVLQTSIPIQVIGNVLSDIYTNPLHDKTPSRKNPGFTVLSVGRFDANKNQGLLLRAFAAADIPGSQLVLIGEGPLQKELVRLANSLEIGDRVFFTGWLPKEAVREQMLCSDVLVVSSKVETFSVVVAEAQACGLPAISTPCGGPAELIVFGSGKVLATFEVKEMAEALLQLRTHLEKYSSAMIRENALAKFGHKAVAAQYNLLFHELLRHCP